MTENIEKEIYEHTLYKRANSLTYQNEFTKTMTVD